MNERIATDTHVVGDRKNYKDKVKYVYRSTTKGLILNLRKSLKKPKLYLNNKPLIKEWLGYIFAMAFMLMITGGGLALVVVIKLLIGA